eukprot:gene7548-10285_t
MSLSDGKINVLESNVDLSIGPKTRYIISTSGRVSSVRRYQRLLQKILGIDVAYIPIHSGDENTAINPQRFVWMLRGLPCIGGAISKDIKSSIIPFLDEIDEIAARVKSVNTVLVLNKNNTIILKGYNTDAIGFRFAIENGIKNSGLLFPTTAVCYGYGGVASVVVTILQDLGIEVFITGRRADAVENRAKELLIKPWIEGQPVDLFINSTPVTNEPFEEVPNFINALKSCKICFDHEMPGKYLQDYCSQNNIYHIQGTDMYYPQMYHQWSFFLAGIVEPDSIPGLIKQAEE